MAALPGLAHVPRNAGTLHEHALAAADHGHSHRPRVDLRRALHGHDHGAHRVFRIERPPRP